LVGIVAAGEADGDPAPGVAEAGEVAALAAEGVLEALAADRPEVAGPAAAGEEKRWLRKST